MQASRTAAQLRHHYEVERRLADQLRSAQKEQRMGMYTAVYDELFNSVPDHPQLTERASQERRRGKAERQVAFLRSLCGDNPVFLEVGPGDCIISLEFSKHAKRVYAVDVSDAIVSQVRPPANFQLALSDGCSVPVPAGTVDLAFSNQLMEHLHPDDAVEQLRNLYAALAPGGHYFCITPNRMSGPHDVSQHFDPVATGFHLREYTTSELISLFTDVGFKRFRVYVGLDGIYARIPVVLARIVEGAFSLLPHRIRRPIAKLAPFRLLLGIRLLATKD